MKRIIAGLIASLMLAATPYAAETAARGARDAPKGARDAGRYQLFQGEFTTYDLKKQQTYTHRAVFHIDTATGRVMRYVNKIDEDGTYNESWVTTELPSAKKK